MFYDREVVVPSMNDAPLTRVRQGFVLLRRPPADIVMEHRAEPVDVVYVGDRRRICAAPAHSAP
jgi:hypothetical protein